MKAALALSLCLTFATSASAQHNIYKCTEGKKITYSNSPCPDGKKLEVKPTKGVSYTGKANESKR